MHTSKVTCGTRFHDASTGLRACCKAGGLLKGRWLASQGRMVAYMQCRVGRSAQHAHLEYPHHLVANRGESVANSEYFGPVS